MLPQSPHYESVFSCVNLSSIFHCKSCLACSRKGLQLAFHWKTLWCTMRNSGLVLTCTIICVCGIKCLTENNNPLIPLRRAVILTATRADNRYTPHCSRGTKTHLKFSVPKAAFRKKHPEQITDCISHIHRQKKSFNRIYCHYR